MAYITTASAKSTIICDIEDLGRISKYNWSSGGKDYPVANIDRRRVPMSHLIVEVPTGYEVDHINRDKHDNRRHNLRVVTHYHNMLNRKSWGISGYKGVTWDKGKRRWRADIVVGGKRIFLGRHKTPEAAHSAYIEASRKYHGDYGCTK